MTLRALVLVLPACAACVGPQAPDAAVCRDFIHRLCSEPRCSALDAVVDAEAPCEDALLARTGCGADDFSFSGLSRQQVLQCRAPLLRDAADGGQGPDCDDVAHVLDTCQDVASFLRTGTQ